MKQPMKLHYRVRSVMLSNNSSAVTLAPGKWFKDSETETVHDDTTGETFPAWEDGEPTDEGAEFDELGGPLTELRFAGSTKLQPNDLVTLTVEMS